MVKISGFGYNNSHTANHFDYISRNAKLELKEKVGQVYQDKNSIHQLAKDWNDTDIQQKRRTRHNHVARLRNQPDLVSLANSK